MVNGFDGSRAGDPQPATLNTHTRYLTDGIVAYAERLLATHTVGQAMGGSPAHAIFTCIGSEANDLRSSTGCGNVAC
jgi:4-aminobutyrate aminotransferase-like enzyme